ncbi:MAG: hypothetical protein NVS2B12_00790 [Ktedonobacteraceae bacterium]
MSMSLLEEGQKFERYQVIRLLGRGGAGMSYEAEDSRIKSRVVLKLIHPWSGVSYAGRRQFFRAMQTLSVLAHPSLTTVLNYGEIAGQLYVARPYKNYGSLLSNEGRTWFNPPLDIEAAFTYAYQLSQALSVIHAQNYTHGALTFSNILIAEQPRKKVDNAPLLLSDAGLAQFVRGIGERQQHTLPMTAAPEQFNGHISPASDQYALATLLYIWLTGRPPFAGSPAEIEQAKLAGTISSLQAQLTGEQERIIQRALNARPDARYPSVLTFAQALMASLQSVPPGKTFETDEPRSISGQEQAKIPRAQDLQITTHTTTNEQEQPAPAGPLPQIEPDVPQPRPAPQPTPIPLPEPVETPPPPQPQTEPEIIPTPGPDIALPLPEQAPPPPATGPVPSQPAPEREVKPPTQEATASHDTEPLSPTVSADAVPAAHLIITSLFSHEPRKVPLQKDETTIGRAGSSDILLDEDMATSRHHAHIKREGGVYVIYDKRSTHGVVVNEQKLAEDAGHVLREGDHIQIGDYTLLFSHSLTQHTDEAHIEHALPWI